MESFQVSCPDPGYFPRISFFPSAEQKLSLALALAIKHRPANEGEQNPEFRFMSGQSFCFWRAAMLWVQLE